MDIEEVSRFRNVTEKSVLRLKTCKKPNNDGRCYVVTVWKPWERERERGAKTISGPPSPVLSVASNEEGTNASRSLCDDPGRDELLSKGYDDNPFNPLGPVYWRVIIRANEKLYASTGYPEMFRIGPITGTAAARIETSATEASTAPLATSAGLTMNAGSMLASAVPRAFFVKARRGAVRPQPIPFT